MYCKSRERPDWIGSVGKNHDAQWLIQGGQQLNDNRGPFVSCVQQRRDIIGFSSWGSHVRFGNVASNGARMMRSRDGAWAAAGIPLSL